MTRGIRRIWGLTALTALALLAAVALAGAEETREDRTPPVTKVTYRPRQDFLASKVLVVRLRSNEAGTAVASGQLEIPSSGIWGVFPRRGAVAARQKATLRLRVPANAREAAQRALNRGERVVAKVVLFAEDLAGNRSGKTVAVIRPTP